MNKVTLLSAFVATLGLGTAFAQSDEDFQTHNIAISIPEIAILDIETTGSENVTFALNADNLEAGAEFIVDEENSDLWINYTSIVAVAGNERSISITADDVPEIDGFTLKVIAAEYSGSGEGTLGDPTTIVTPSESPTDIITGIGSAFTGDGNSNGHNLTYYLDFDGDFADLNVDDAGMNIEIKYTITD